MKAVGYLWSGRSYPKGKVSRLFFARLVELVEDPLWHSGGYHNCNLGWCSLKESVNSPPSFRYRRRILALGSSEIWVPGNEAVYCAPSLILHYIRGHKYKPPECFCAAVLNCPKPNSNEYFSAIKEIAPDVAKRFRFPQID